MLLDGSINLSPEVRRDDEVPSRALLSVIPTRTLFSRLTLRSRRPLNNLDLTPLRLEDVGEDSDDEGHDVDPEDDDRNRPDKIQGPPDDAHLCFLSTRLRRGFSL